MNVARLMMLVLMGVGSMSARYEGYCYINKVTNNSQNLVTFRTMDLRGGPKIVRYNCQTGLCTCGTSELGSTTVGSCFPLAILAGDSVDLSQFVVPQSKWSTSGKGISSWIEVTVYFANTGRQQQYTIVQDWDTTNAPVKIFKDVPQRNAVVAQAPGFGGQNATLELIIDAAGNLSLNKLSTFD